MVYTSSAACELGGRTDKGVRATRETTGFGLEQEGSRRPPLTPDFGLNPQQAVTMVNPLLLGWVLKHASVWNVYAAAKVRMLVHQGPV
jgi:tRNA U38,U39,U40 pseudouridine synthase TruA